MRRFRQTIHAYIKKSTGFTLIELMIALFVFAIGMLAITAMCLISIQGNSLVNRTTQANFLAQSRMEELLSEPNITVLNSATLSIEGGAYTRDEIVETVAGEPDIRWVTVSVRWTDAKGDHQVTLKSLVREQ